MAKAMLLPCLMAVAMLLFGCISEPKPNEGLQGAVVGSAGEVMGGMESSKPPPPNGAQKQNTSCTLEVRQASVQAGGLADVYIRAAFQGTGEVHLYCGGEARRLQGENGLSLSTKCRLDRPGFQKIVLGSGGVECASDIVQVVGGSQGSCYIDGASVQRDLSAYTYSWQVYFSGFSENDAITWLCDGEIGSRNITADLIWGLPKYETASCSFASRPESDAIPVMAGGAPCGNVSTR